MQKNSEIQGISFKLYIFERSYLWKDATNFDEIWPQDRSIFAKLFDRALLIAAPSIMVKKRLIKQRLLFSKIWTIF